MIKLFKEIANTKLCGGDTLNNIDFYFYFQLIANNCDRRENKSMCL